MTTVDANLDDLQQEREFLLRSLRDLEAEHDAGDIDEADYQTLRDDYTARAATVLRAIGAARTTNGRVAGDRPGQLRFGPGDRDVLVAAQRSRRRWRLTAIAAIVAIAGGIAVWAVSSSSGSRQPGQTVSGNGQLAGSADPRLARAGQLVNKGKITDALKLYDQILRDDPNQPEALADEGWLIGQAGLAANRPDLVDQGLAKLVASEKLATSYATPHFFRGFLLLRAKNDAPGAVTELRTYLGLVNPASPEVPQVEQLLQSAIRAAGGNVSPGPNAPPSSGP